MKIDEQGNAYQPGGAAASAGMARPMTGGDGGY
jgi:hypothetical protein